MNNIYIQKSIFDMKINLNNNYEYNKNQKVQLIYTVAFSKFVFKLLVCKFKKIFFKISIFLLRLCGTKCKVKKNTERNGKNYYLNVFLRGQFLDSKTKTRGTALNLQNVL